MKVFESERLCFRLMEPKDEDALFAVWGDPDTMRYCGRTAKRERIPKIIEYDRCQFEKYGNAVFALVKKSDDKLIGICGGKLDEDDPSHVEAILHLHKSAWGKGYGTEALKAYIAWLKETNRASLVYASAHPDNSASLSMIIKCGFIQLGYKRYEDTGFINEPYFELDIGQQ